jgi:hypothetical protein
VDLGQNQEATNGDDNAVFPVNALGRKQPKVDAQEQSQRNLEEHIDERKQGALGGFKPSGQKDDLQEHDKL